MDIRSPNKYAGSMVKLILLADAFTLLFFVLVLRDFYITFFLFSE